jgi:hypothetical protein
MSAVLSPAVPLESAAHRGRPAIARPRRAGLLALISLAALLVCAAPAFADYETALVNQDTDRCLTGGGGAAVWASNCEYSHSATWKVHQWRDGTVQLRPWLSDHRCLDDSEHGLRSFAPCWAPSSRYSRYQSWYVIHQRGPYYAYRNQATGRCLDDSRAFGVRTFPCNGLPFQGWMDIDLL